jgi:hypothetical protein
LRAQAFLEKQKAIRQSALFLLLLLALSKPGATHPTLAAGGQLRVADVAGKRYASVLLYRC